MKAILLISFLALTAAQAAPIAKITTLRGKTYRQCEIVKVHPDGVSFTHAAGAAKILFTDLSKEWRTRLGYDSEKASVYQKELAEKRQQLAAAKVKREQELSQAMAQAEQAARFRQLGLAAQADAARAQQLASPLPQPLFPVLPALGAVYDGRSVAQSYARPGYGTPWCGGFSGNFGHPGYGIQFGSGFGYGGFTGGGFGAFYTPTPYFCQPPAIIVSPHTSRHTIIRR
jgi:hypothetical protein